MTDDAKDEPGLDGAGRDDERSAFDAKREVALAEAANQAERRDEDEERDEDEDEEEDKEEEEEEQDDADADADPSPAPEYELFSARAIGWCTLFFSSLVGGLMAAANHRRLGDEQKARGTAALAVGAVVAFMLIGYFVDSPAVNGGISGGTGALAWGLYKEQKPLVAAHLGRGGHVARPWIPVLAGFGLLALFGLGLYLQLNSTSNTAFQAGVVAAQAEDWPAAEARFREVIAEDPERDDARYNLGVSLMNQGKNREARRELSRIHDDSEVAPDASRLRLQLSP